MLILSQHAQKIIAHQSLLQQISLIIFGSSLSLSLQLSSSLELSRALSSFLSVLSGLPCSLFNSIFVTQ